MEAADAALLAAEDAGVMPAGEVAVLALRALNAEEAWFDARDAWRPPVSDRQLAAEDLAAEFGTDVSEWLI
jgi:hypothetical protein